MRLCWYEGACAQLCGDVYFVSVTETLYSTSNLNKKQNRHHHVDVFVESDCLSKYFYV